MNAVGRLGSYISRSVYVVSGPFHPFGGAVDIIVVEQPDGSFKSSPWYVRFGKFQGVLKANDKIVSVIVNGVEADFHMYLDPKGEAHFIRKVDAEDGDIISVSPLSSLGEDKDGQSHIRRPIKSKSWNFDSHQCETATQIDVSDVGIVDRTNSRRSQILGFVMGRRSVREGSLLDGKNDSCFETKESLESAEMAADLMELKWSRSLVSSMRNKDAMKGLSTGVQNNEDSVKNETVVDNLVKSSPLQQDDSLNYEKDHLSCSIPTEFAKESEMEIPCLVSTYVAGTSPVECNNKPVFEMLLGNELLCVSDGGECMNSVDAKFEAFSTEQDLQTTDTTFQDKCQSDIGSTSMDSSCGMVNEKKLECDGVPLDHVDNEFITEPFSNRVLFQPLLENNKSEDGKMDVQVSPLDTVDCPVRSCLQGSESSDELFFGELDDMKGIDRTPHHHERESELLVSQIRNEEINESSIGNDVSRLSPEKSCINYSATIDKDMKLKSVSSDLNIHEKTRSEVEEVSRIAISLPNMSLPDSDLNDCRDSHTTLQDNVLRERESEADKGSECINVGPSSPPLDASPKSWKSWSFSSDRNSDAQNVSKKDGTDDERVPILKATKKNIRTTTPTTEELKSLNLKEGTNIVEFTFSTPMLGRQQVEARIHLWKWDSRIVISDVDGTITRSDVLGQVMPLVGVDWSQTGVAHLFSAIKENGYHVLFLSARAISQAYSTRQFLCNLKQDGKALPEGPVVISPDGLFPSLYREVVRRAPHEFKISCLEAIKALFPTDRNPFYAGFGNRDTDEISYFKVGIPRGKIFIINPKGEIVVNRRVDRKSYTSLHALVDDMFPLMSSSEQEDFNSWNYWKLPLPSTDM